MLENLCLILIPTSQNQLDQPNKLKNKNLNSKSRRNKLKSKNLKLKRNKLPAYSAYHQPLHQPVCLAPVLQVHSSQILLQNQIHKPYQHNHQQNYHKQPQNPLKNYLKTQKELMKIQPSKKKRMIKYLPLFWEVKTKILCLEIIPQLYSLKNKNLKSKKTST